MPLPAASRRLWGRAATLQSVRLLGLLLQLRGALEQGSHSHTASRSAAKSSTSAQASQAVSTWGSHLAAGSSTGAQASQAVSARCCHLAADSSTSAQASRALGGRGPPIQVTYKSTTRSLHDGGGLCSPGRWPPGRRRLPGASCDAVRAAFTDGLRSWQKRLKEAPGSEGRAFAELASGKLKSAPCKGETRGGRLGGRSNSSR